ncbi:MAG: hypothetical protein R2776_06320 [Flavobacteriaceae bacterium]
MANITKESMKIKFLKSSILIFLILFTNENILSQEKEITIECSIENIENSFSESLLFARQDESEKIFVVQKIYRNSSTPKGYYIKRFSDKLLLEDRSQIDLENNEIRGMYVNDTKIFLIQFEYSRESKAYLLNLLSSSKTTFNFKKSLLFSIDRQDIDKYEMFGENEKSAFPNKEDFISGGNLVSSDNGKYHCYSVRLKRKESSKNLFLIFDENFNLITQNIYEDSGKGNVLINEISVTNDGKIYFLSKKYEKTIPISKIVPGVQDYKIQLHTLFNGNFKEINISESGLLGGSAFITTNDVYSSIVGFYSNKENTMFSSAGYSGVFVFDLNHSNNEISNFNKYNFTEFLSNKREKPVNKIQNYLAFKDIYTENESLIFNSEVHYTDGGNNACMHYGNILSIKFNKNGELNWVNTINKDQEACFGWGKTYKYSFVSLYDSSEIYYVSNYDFENNIDLDKDVNSLCNVLKLNTVNNTESIFKLSRRKASEIYFKNYVQINNQLIITEGIDNNGNPSLIKLSLQ